ncbi:MAG: hypothetical protein KF729_36195 [Sandaracinaceae bacterium]|nr:hypothetical protein [Sandaracinaceae bacterium]
MAATTIDLRLSGALAPRPLDTSAPAPLTLDPADEAITATNALGQRLQSWQVARVHLVEELGQPFRCEVIITRLETLRADPSAPQQASNTVFDDVSNAIDDGTGSGNDLRSANDNLDRGLRPWDDIANAPANIAAIARAINDAARVASQTATTVANGLQQQDLEQYLLGIPLPTPWSPETPPRPGVFLDKRYSVLVTRNGRGDTPLVGRWVTGLVTEHEDLGVTGTGHRLVRLVIEPQLARLALRTNTRVFEQQAPMQIVRTIFEEAGIYQGDFEPPGLGATRAFTIQYGETDLDFVMRLFSEEGLVPVFECRFGAERLGLVLPEELASGGGVRGFGADGAIETLDADDLVRALPDEVHHGVAPDATSAEVLWDFSVARAVAPLAVRTRSVDFSSSYAGPSEVPTHVHEGEAEADGDVAIDQAFAGAVALDVHRFPARTSFSFDPESAVQTDVVDPHREARLELVAERARVRRARGRTNAVGLAAGQRVTVTEGRPGVDPALFDDELRPDGQFVITRLELFATNQTTVPTFPLPPPPEAFSTGSLPFEAVIEAVPSADPFLPPRRRAPRVDGVQSAITRASATEWQEGHGRIGVDPIGRVRATLPWDRRAPERGEIPRSPPIRVATPWAGHAWGTTFLPREGMELLVAYADGDPCQPIALGFLHGIVNPAPRERPHVDFVTGDNRIDPGKEEVVGDDPRRLHYEPSRMARPVNERHLNAIRTAVHPAPADDAFKAFHELSFEDAPGRERVRLHSAGRLDEEAVNDQRVWVGRDQMNVVQGMQAEHVREDATLVVRGERIKVVTGHEDRGIAGRQDVTVRGDKSLIVRGDLERWVGADAPSKDLHRIGLEPGAGVRRQLTSVRDRLTKIQGDDERVVGGDVDVRCGETFELGGAPFSMSLPDDGAGGAPSMSNDAEDGVTTLDGGAGVCELVADGPVKVAARVIDLDGASAVRLECGEVSVELSPGVATIRAPGGVSFSVAGRAAPSDGGSVPSSSSSLELEAPGGAIVLKLADHTATDGGRFVALLRAGEAGGAYLDAEDALSGGPGVKIAPVDRFEMRGGMGAFKCRRVETQRAGGPKEVVRDMTPHELQLLADIAALKREIERRERRVRDAIARRDAARAEYQAASRERAAAEERIKEDDGIDEELGDAIDRVTAAEKGLQEARRRERIAQDAYREAFRTGQRTDKQEDALEQARDAVKEAQEELDEAEEQLEETRAEHGGLMDDYVAAKKKQEQKAAALDAAQRDVVRAQDELRSAERELAAKEAEASELELFDDEPPAEEAAE